MTNLFQRSLKTRITLITLIIFVVSNGVMAFYASRVLQDEMSRKLGRQQFSTVSLLATQVDDELRDRISVLEGSARQITPALLRNAVALQQWIDQDAALRILFNGGGYVTGVDGMARASTPISAGRAGLGFLEQSHVAAALKGGKTTIGKPRIGKALKTPVIGIATPLRDAHGQVIGALVGVIDLSKTNFLDRITENRFGSTGGYLLIAPQHDLFVTATDKRRTMQPLPARGVNLMHDRYMLGYEGYGVATNSRGVEELSAAKGISAAGWFMVAVLPVEEAFAPIYAMQQGLLLAGMALTLLACCLIWWMLKRELSPMLFTVKTLASLPDGSAPVQPLPIFRQDEIGELVGGFNRLLSSLMRHDEVLAKEKAFTETVLDEQLDSILVYESATGKAIRWNKTFRQMSGYTDEEIAGLTAPDAYFDRGDPARAAAAVASAPGAVPLQAERSLICKDGRKIVIECRESFIQGGAECNITSSALAATSPGARRLKRSLNSIAIILKPLCLFVPANCPRRKKPPKQPPGRRANSWPR